MRRIRQVVLCLTLSIAATASLAVAPTSAQTTEEYQNFVGRSYAGLLQRGPESPAFETWVAALEGGLPRTEFALALLRSAEFRELIVNDMYGAYLDRPADPAGLAGFAPLIDGGSSWEQVQRALLGSAEFFGLVSNDDTEFVAALYFLLLDRAPDAAGFDFYLQRLNEGWSNQMVAEAFVLSPEARSRVIDALYDQLLGRGVDPGALAVWVTRPYETVVVAILGSDEFFNLPTPP